MKTIVLTSFILGLTFAAAGCKEDKGLNKAGLTVETYQPSGSVKTAMTFPAGDQTVFKAFGHFKDPQLPQPYQQPKTWVVYMAAPGWTNGGTPIVDRNATDASAVERVKQFVRDNRLQDTVKVAWLQYDQNPDPLYVESLKKVPDNFIPLFLKTFGPQVDYYIYSPAIRHGVSGASLRYDQWIKPYLPYAKKQGSDYVSTSDFHRNEGFDQPDGKYWDSWARHWFIVNPDGIVVDAYFSNLGKYGIQGADIPINSLIKNLKLDPKDLEIPKIFTSNYQSFYTAPYWNKLTSDFQNQVGMDGSK
jgi:hypothetical protein